MRGANNYRADIDALRALAVLPVMLFHFDKGLLPGGYLGVDVFFVISGYLITGLLVAELASGTFDLTNFWRRRILRIVPALTVVVVVTFVLGQWLLFAPERRDLAINSTAALLSFSNFTHWLNYGGYWGADAGTSPLLHTWSLGVEEQFYLIYPMLVWLVWRLRKSALVAVLAAGLIASLCLFLYGLESHPSAAFYLLPTRAWELAAGALAAKVNLNLDGKPIAAKTMAWAGLIFVLCAYAFAAADGTGYWSIAAVAGAAMIVGVGTDRPLRSIGMTNRVLIFIGLISYSLYLWHWPVIVLARSASERFGFESGFLPLLVLTFVLAYLSWRFVETSMRRKRQLAPAIALIAVVLAVGAFGVRTFNGTEGVSGFEPTRWAGNQFNVNPRREWPEAVRHRMTGIEVLQRDPSADDAEFRVLRRFGDEKINVLVLGDSHGLMWAPAIDEVLRQLRKTAVFMTADGTKVFFDPSAIASTPGNQFFTAAQMAEFRRSQLDVIRTQRPEVVIIAARWSQYAADQAIPLLNEISAAGSRVILLGDAPALDVGDRNLPEYLSFLGLEGASSAWVPRLDSVDYRLGQTVFQLISASCGEPCLPVETSDLYLRGRDKAAVVQVLANRHVLYIDDDHLSVAGALLASDRIRGSLTRAFDRRSSMQAVGAIR